MLDPIIAQTQIDKQTVAHKLDERFDFRNILLRPALMVIGNNIILLSSKIVLNLLFGTTYHCIEFKSKIQHPPLPNKSTIQFLMLDPTIQSHLSIFTLWLRLGPTSFFNLHKVKFISILKSLLFPGLSSLTSSTALFNCFHFIWLLEFVYWDISHLLQLRLFSSFY